MVTERDTNIDFDLVHAQIALKKGITKAAALGFYSDIETTEVALSQKPSLVIEQDLIEPPFTDEDHLGVLEKYLGGVYGGRKDIRVIGLRASKDFVEIKVGAAFPGEDTNVTEVLDNPSENLEYNSSVYILHNDEGRGKLWVYPRVFTNSPKPLSKVVYYVPPKVYIAIGGIFAAEFDPGKISIKIDGNEKAEDARKVSAWNPAPALQPTK